MEPSRSSAAAPPLVILHPYDEDVPSARNPPAGPAENYAGRVTTAVSCSRSILFTESPPDLLRLMQDTDHLHPEP